MFTFIKNLITGYKVCSKYSLKYIPFPMDTIEGYYNFIDGTVTVCPFHKDFQSILFHEIGHHVHHKLVNYHTYFNPVDTFVYNGMDFIKVMQSESFASRFAMKTKKSNIGFLMKCFNSYSSLLLTHKHIHLVGKFAAGVDVIHKGVTKIKHY